MVLSCPEHPNKRCEMFCTNCGSLVCLLCIENNHIGHQFISFTKMIDTRKIEINQNRHLLSERLEAYRGILGSGKARSEYLERKQASEEQKIAKIAETLHRGIDAAKSKCEMELKKFIRKTTEDLDTSMSKLTADLYVLERVLDTSANTVDDETVTLYAQCIITNYQGALPTLEQAAIPAFDIFGHLQSEVVESDDADIKKSLSDEADTDIFREIPTMTFRSNHFSGDLHLTVPADDEDGIHEAEDNEDGIHEAEDNEDGIHEAEDNEDGIHEAEDNEDEKEIFDLGSPKVPLFKKMKGTTRNIKSFMFMNIDNEMARVSATTFSNVWVSESKSGTVKLYHKDGATIKTFASKREVYDLDVNDSGLVFLTKKEGRSVWKYSRSDHRPSRFITFDDKTTTNGICVTKIGHLLVCLNVRNRGAKIVRLSDNGLILQHIELDKDGSRLFNLPTYVHHDKVTGDILVIDEQKVIVVDELGMKKITISGDTYQGFDEQTRSVSARMFKPVDLEITQTGHIVISDNGNGRICVFDKDGQFTELCLKEKGKPSGISFDDEGTLWVALAGS